FKKELNIPSEVVDRSSLETWQKSGGNDAFQRAAQRVETLLKNYRPNTLSADVRAELTAITTRAARACGLDQLPSLV
ncbi:MAG TPA: trimethylamine methyltransferase family protein, partial [Anaerolineales bacterium]